MNLFSFTIKLAATAISSLIIYDIACGHLFNKHVINSFDTYYAYYSEYMSNNL